MSFLVLDAVLGMKVKVYDSSWIEWGNLSDEEGTLASDSPWLTNNSTYTEALNETISTNAASPLASCSYADSGSATNDNDKNVCDDDDDDDDDHHGDDDDVITYNQTYDCNGNIN